MYFFFRCMGLGVFTLHFSGNKILKLNREWSGQHYNYNHIRIVEISKCHLFKTHIIRRIITSFPIFKNVTCFLKKCNVFFQKCNVFFQKGSVFFLDYRLIFELTKIYNDQILPTQQKTAFVLSGGGLKGAYQLRMVEYLHYNWQFIVDRFSRYANPRVSQLVSKDCTFFK